MISKYQQKIILKLKENEMFAAEQRIFARKDSFYRNVSFLMRKGVVKFRKDYDNNRYIYSLTDSGRELAKLLEVFV